MTTGSKAASRLLPDGRAKRRMALIAACSLLLMALLAPFAHFGVLQTLIVPGDAAATTAGIAGSAAIFRAAIAAFLVVAILDVVAAWSLYVLLRPVNEGVALLVGWLRVTYAAVFAYALVNLLDVAQLLAGAPVPAPGAPSVQLQVLVASAVASFGNGWDLALAIFGLHLVGLGALLLRSTEHPRVLGALVVVAGAGYLADSFGTILVAGYSLTVATFTFAGEALLIPWLLWVAIRTSRRAEGSQAAVPAPARSPRAATS